MEMQHSVCAVTKHGHCKAKRAKDPVVGKNDMANREFGGGEGTIQLTPTAEIEQLAQSASELSGKWSALESRLSFWFGYIAFGAVVAGAGFVLKVIASN